MIVAPGMTPTTHRTDLRTRLREYRKAKGWTLAHVADALGTTPQTVSRLETNVMTVSTDWLQRFADLFEVDVVNLFEGARQFGVHFLGVVGSGGTVTPGGTLDLPLPPLIDGVAVAIQRTYGSFYDGQYILGEQTAAPADALDRICIAKIREGDVFLGRLISGKGKTYTLVPLDGGKTHYDCELEWTALPVFSIQDLRRSL